MNGDLQDALGDYSWGDETQGLRILGEPEMGQGIKRDFFRRCLK